LAPKKQTIHITETLTHHSAYSDDNTYKVAIQTH